MFLTLFFVNAHNGRVILYACTGRTLYARVAALIPEHRQRIAAAAAAKGATAKGGAAKKGAGNAAGKGGKDGKAGAGGKSGGKGGVKVTVAPKKKKKGKR